MKKYPISIIILTCSIFIVSAHAQNNSDSAIALFGHLSSIYAKADHISFSLTYSYANENAPNILTDSLFGKFKINKSNYHIQLGNTETIKDSGYNIILFKEDTLMYISKPRDGQGGGNPISMIDTLLKKIPNIQLSLTRLQDVQVITMVFPSGMDYKKAEFFIEKKTGYLKKCRYVLKGASWTNATKDNSGWNILECKFSNYEVGKFNDNEFDHAKYFVKDVKGYKPVETYKNYKIFIANPDL